MHSPVSNSLVQISIDVYEDGENGKCRRERRASEGELEREARAKVSHTAGTQYSKYVSTEGKEAFVDS